MSILVGDYHILNDLLDILVSSFYHTIHLWPIRKELECLIFHLAQSSIITLP